MKKEKVIVISLGGSIIMPVKQDFKILDGFKRVLRKHYNNHRFVVVCGGGSIARKYIDALAKEGKSKYEIAMAGIRATRMNALFMIQFFGKDANVKLPLNMEQVENDLKKNKVVFCGALRFAPSSTTDGTASKLAHFLNTEFINITNVPGLYTEDPRKNKNAKLIPKISWKDFNNMIKKIKFHAGQHFVLDQQASNIIRKNRIRTYIIGSNFALDNLLKGKKFIGTIISG
ncbi:UMP kinase [Candidatus Pacearchaeota archaeon]|nr:UMP kinase [Candidatus Pacearchaeota archaeon]